MPGDIYVNFTPVKLLICKGETVYLNEPGIASLSMGLESARNVYIITNFANIGRPTISFPPWRDAEVVVDAEKCIWARVADISGRPDKIIFLDVIGLGFSYPDGALSFSEKILAAIGVFAASIVVHHINKGFMPADINQLRIITNVIGEVLPTRTTEKQIRHMQYMVLVTDSAPAIDLENLIPAAVKKNRVEKLTYTEVTQKFNAVMAAPYSDELLFQSVVSKHMLETIGSSKWSADGFFQSLRTVVQQQGAGKLPTVQELRAVANLHQLIEPAVEIYHSRMYASRRDFPSSPEVVLAHHAEALNLAVGDFRANTIRERQLFFKQCSEIENQVQVAIAEWRKEAFAQAVEYGDSPDSFKLARAKILYGGALKQYLEENEQKSKEVCCEIFEREVSSLRVFINTLGDNYKDMDEDTDSSTLQHSKSGYLNTVLGNHQLAIVRVKKRWSDVGSLRKKGLSVTAVYDREASGPWRLAYRRKLQDRIKELIAELTQKAESAREAADLMILEQISIMKDVLYEVRGDVRSNSASISKTAAELEAAREERKKTSVSIESSLNIVNQDLDVLRESHKKLMDLSRERGGKFEKLRLRVASLKREVAQVTDIATSTETSSALTGMQKRLGTMETKMSKMCRFEGDCQRQNWARDEEIVAISKRTENHATDLSIFKGEIDGINAGLAEAMERLNSHDSKKEVGMSAEQFSHASESMKNSVMKCEKAIHELKFAVADNKNLARSGIASLAKVERMDAQRLEKRIGGVEDSLLKSAQAISAVAQGAVLLPPRSARPPVGSVLVYGEQGWYPTPK